MSETPRQPRIEIIPPGAEGRGPRPEPGDLEVAGGPRRKRSPFKVMLSMIPGVNTLYALWLYLLDDSGSDLHRLLILFALFYLISPMDAVPDFLGPFGFADDAGVIFFLVKFIGSAALQPYRERAKERLRRG